MDGSYRKEEDSAVRGDEEEAVKPDHRCQEETPERPAMLRKNDPETPEGAEGHPASPFIHLGRHEGLNIAGEEGDWKATNERKLLQGGGVERKVVHERKGTGNVARKNVEPFRGSAGWRGVCMCVYVYVCGGGMFGFDTFCRFPLHPV